MSDFSFQQLDPNLILDALEQLDVRATTGLLALNSYENRVYQFASEDNGRLVAKFYRPERWTNEQILEEHEFSLQLAEEEIPVVAPLKFSGKTLHTYQDYRFALFPSVGGRQFEVDNLDQLEWMGRFLGRIHACAKQQHFVHRPSINCEDFLHKPKRQLTNSQLVPAHLHAPFFTILELTIELAEQQFTSSASDLTNIRLHGDCHPGNILWRDGPMFVDLDDCRSGPAIQDIWMMLTGDHQQQHLQLETLLEAYQEFCDFDERELVLVECLRAMRMVHYMAWLELRWQDPAFPRAFPWFAEDKYWENQILALKEQFAAMQQPPIKLTPY